MHRVGLFIATCGYLGYVPVAPGTFGSAAGLVVFYAVRSTGSAAVELAAIILLFAIGIWSGTVAEHHFGGVDPGPVVLDEVVGMLVTLAFLPVSATGLAVAEALARAWDGRTVLRSRLLAAIPAARKRATAGLEAALALLGAVPTEPGGRS